MRGCWIAREGAGAIFLRLLTPEPGADTITGSIDRARPEGAERIAAFNFARDGSSVTAELHGRPAMAFSPASPTWAPKGRNWIVYRSEAAPYVFVVIEAPGETLRIMSGHGDGEPRPVLAPVYEANRDGCD